MSAHGILMSLLVVSVAGVTDEDQLGNCSSINRLSLASSVVAVNSVNFSAHKSRDLDDRFIPAATSPLSYHHEDDDDSDDADDDGNGRSLSPIMSDSPPPSEDHVTTRCHVTTRSGFIPTLAKCTASPLLSRQQRLLSSSFRVSWLTDIKYG